jgi:hypothetical protein
MTLPVLPAPTALTALTAGLERTERARLTLERLDAARTRVAFTVTVLRPGSDATLRTQRARMAHELAAARRILEAAA